MEKLIEILPVLFMAGILITVLVLIFYSERSTRRKIKEWSEYKEQDQLIDAVRKARKRR